MNVTRWFSQTNPEDDLGTEHELEWPPTFESFAEHRANLTTAIESHPPFGEWLRSIRSIAHIVRIQNPDSMWHMSVEQLKERYVRDKTIQTHRVNSKRAFAQMHMEAHAEEFEKAKNDFTSKQEAFNVAHQQYKDTVSHGYKIRAPEAPMKSEALQLLEKLRAVADAE